jgi:hypothetical protein
MQMGTLVVTGGSVPEFGAPPASIRFSIRKIQPSEHPDDTQSPLWLFAHAFTSFVRANRRVHPRCSRGL